MTITLHSESEDQTISYARMLAGQLQRGDVVFLCGDLGAGKSVFARALIRAMAGQSDLEVPSPTFTLVQTYETPSAALWHFDLYRIKHNEEIFELGWEEALIEGILLIEWPQRLEGLAPDDRLEIDFEISTMNSDERFMTVTQQGAWGARVLDFQGQK